jgi:hypothetical protein
MSAAIDEIRNLAGTWDSMSLEQRRAIFDWWVVDMFDAWSRSRASARIRSRRL